MLQLNSYQVVLKDTAEAIIVPLKHRIFCLDGVFQALIKADVNPVIGQCSNYNSIRQQIVQAHQYLQMSEQKASSGLKSLDENLERLIQDEGNLIREISDTNQTLNNLRQEQTSNEQLLRNSQGALEQARRNLDSTKQTLQDQENRKRNAKIITGVGAGVFLIPGIGWAVGLGMMIGGGVGIGQSKHAIRVAEEEVRKSNEEVERYQHKVYEYESRISEILRDISQKDVKLKEKQNEIQNTKKKTESVVEFQQKVRSAVHVLSVLSGRVSVAEHQTRSFILKEPIVKVMEDVMKAAQQLTGNELLCDSDIPNLINQMKKDSQTLEAICASEINSENNTDYD